MIPVQVGSTDPQQIKNTEDKVEKKRKPYFSVRLLLVISENIRMSIGVTFGQPEYGKMYVKGRLYWGLWRLNEADDPHFLFHFLMSYDHPYKISENKINSSQGAYTLVRP